MNPNITDRARHGLRRTALPRDRGGTVRASDAGTICDVCRAAIAARNLRIDLERDIASLRIAALGAAEQHVAEGDERLVRQQEIVDSLTRGGHDIRPALRILQRLEDKQRLHVADRARLLDELYRA